MLDGRNACTQCLWFCSLVCKYRGTESTAASEASNEPVTITFAQYSGSGDNEQYLQQMVDNYMKENPNVTIDLQTYGYDDYFTQMTAKVSGGQAPDVFELDYQNFVSYAKKGALMPLDDILTKDGIDTSIYNDMALKAFSADGVQYGVPDSFSNVVLIYNKDLFDQAGIDYPTDDWKWEDAMAAAEKIRALGDNIFGYYHPSTSSIRPLSRTAAAFSMMTLRSSRWIPRKTLKRCSTWLTCSRKPMLCPPRSRWQAWVTGICLSLAALV